MIYGMRSDLCSVNVDYCNWIVGTAATTRLGTMIQQQFYNVVVPNRRRNLERGSALRGYVCTVHEQHAYDVDAPPFRR